MSKKSFFVLFFLLVGFSSLFAAELSGTYSNDYTVRTEFNTISKGKTLHITNGSTYVMRDAIVEGSIIVDKGCSIISPDDYEGYLVFHQGAHVEGIDLYYKVRVSEELVLIRKIPMTLDEVWASNNQELKDWVGIIEFCYSPELKGWVSIGEVRFVNPFNENLYEDYVMEYTLSLEEVLKDAPPPTVNEISGTYKKDFTVKTENNRVSKGKTLRVKKGVTFIMTDAIVSGSIVVENGGSLIAEGDKKGWLAFKQGSSVKGLDLYYLLRVSDDIVYTRKIPMTLEEVWKSKNKELIDIVENMSFWYSTELNGWINKYEIRFMNPFNEDVYIPNEKDNQQSASNGGGGGGAAPEISKRDLSGTYDKDYTVRTDFNIIAEGKTLHVTNGATYVMRDAIVYGNIVVDEGCSFISPDDYEGYLVFKPGTHVDGIDLYYKVRVSDDLMFTRKIPMTLDEIWSSGNQQIIDLIGNMEFCYSPELKGWVSINEIRFMNPFNENLYEGFDLVFTKSVSKVIENECNSLIVKNRSKVVIQPNPDVWGTKVNESIIIESGSSLVGTGPDGHKLQLKKGIKIEGLPVYVKFNNKLIPVSSIISDLSKIRAFNENEYNIVYYSTELKGWVFQDITLGENDAPDDLKKELEKLNKKSKK